MSGEAAAIVGAILGVQLTAIVVLAYAIARVRERLARLEQRLDDRNGLPIRHDR